MTSDRLAYLDAFIADALAADVPAPPVPETPGFWQGLRQVKRVDNPATAHPRQWQDLATFRQTVAARMRSYMAEPDPDYMLLIPAPPGSGKTWAGVALAHHVYDTTQHRVLYAGPRKEFFADVLQTSVRQEQDLNLWYGWKARQENEDIRLHTCNHAGPINEWLQMGYDGMKFCKQRCGWDYINDGCPYHAQKKRTEPLIYGHHLHVTLGHPLASQFAVVVGDELPLDAFLHEWIIPPSRVKFADVPLEYPLAPILYDLNRLCADKIGITLSGPELLSRIGGPDAIRDAITPDVLALFQNADVITPRIASDGDLSRLPANYLPVFLPILLAEAEAAAAGQEYPHRLSVNKNGLTILTRREVNSEYRKHLIWFDATGTASLYEAMFRRPVEVLDAQPKPAGRIFQITDRGNGKGSLIRRPDNEDGTPGELTETHRAEQLRKQIAQIAADYKAPGVIVHKALEDATPQAARHFYGARGTNEFENCDVLIVAGTPQPPLDAIEKAARCLWPERMRPFDKTRLTVDRPYSYIGPDGEGYSYPISEFVDPSLNVLLWQWREGEIIQAAHRSRMLFRETDVYLLTNIPIDELPPTRLLTIRELFGAPEGVDVYKWGAVLEFVESRDIVTATDLTEAIGINREAANKYIGLLIEQYGWLVEKGARRPGARGAAPKAARKAL